MFEFSSMSIQGEDPDDELALPEDGAMVHGLFTDAWKWDDENMCMTESDYGVMNTSLPVFHMLPEMDFTPPKVDYICPLYKEGLRAGTLSTTGNYKKQFQAWLHRPEYIGSFY